MKKIFFYFFSICLTIFFNSCDNEINEQESGLKSNSVSARMCQNEIAALYQTIIAKVDVDDQILAASTLSSEDKYSLWIHKLDEFSGKNSLSSEQNLFIENLKSELNEDLFLENSDARNRFIDERSSILMESAKDLFGDNEGWYLLTKVENINHRIDRFNNGFTINNEEGGVLRACNCAGDSGCRRITGVSIVGFSWEYGTCGGSCYAREYFWGLWESDDDGRCRY